MKIDLLGTAAYERVPALFCNCPACRLARKEKGKYIRTNAQALIDDTLLIDFGMDNYWHSIVNGKDFSLVQNILLTHAHDDHFTNEEFTMRGSYYGHNLHYENVPIYGNEECYEKFLKNEEVYSCNFNRIKAFQTIRLGKYTAVSLPAHHGTRDPLCYIIKDEKNTIFYSLDTGFLSSETYEWIGRQEYVFDLVICDCTFGAQDIEDGGGHMSLRGNVKHRQILKELGCVSQRTKWVITHFSHNGLCINGEAVTYQTLESMANERGMELAYDGMTIEINQ